MRSVAFAHLALRRARQWFTSLPPGGDSEQHGAAREPPLLHEPTQLVRAERRPLRPAAAAPDGDRAGRARGHEGGSPRLTANRY